jgi:Tol biopolymer transport system component
MNINPYLCAAVLWTMVQTVARAEIPVGRFVDDKPVAGLDSPVFDRSPSISKDGKTIYFSSSRPDPFANNAEDIWVSTRNNINDPFGPPVRLDSPVNSDANEREPKMSDDGMTLYFTSDRDEGSGGLDIWMATRDMPTGPFSEVTNLGNIVNSSSDDGTIDVSSDGRAYFTSNRPEGEGDFDLYSVSRTENGIFGDLVNLASVNTAGLDFGPSLSSDGRTMFFSDAGSLQVATRENLGDAFGNRVNLNNFSLGSHISGLVYYPSVSDDWPAHGSKLYFTSGPFQQDADIYEATWVPEPSTSVLAVIGLLGVLTWRCRRLSHL